RWKIGTDDLWRLGPVRVSISDIETTPSMILMRASRIASKARLLVRRRASVLAKTSLGPCDEENHRRIGELVASA
ncbi:MAG: hypothetical protein ACON5J_16170, partial [Rubripirellula sp.]